MSFVPKSSILFARARQVIARNKSTFVYEADKSFSQRFLEKRVKRVQELQKLHGAEDGVPLWWKSTGDRVATTIALAGTIASCIFSGVQLYRFSTGKL